MSEVCPMKKIIASFKTIEILRVGFGQKWISEQIVSGNGPQFTLHEKLI